MDKFLRQLDRTIPALPPAERKEALDGLRSLFRSVPTLKFLGGVSKMGMLDLIASISLSLSSGRSFDEWFASVKKRSQQIAPNVTAFFQSL